jgi:DNA-binding SARP family transcriptional activator
VEFRILGPLEVAGARGPVDLGGTRQQVVLAILLLDVGRVVTTDTLVAEVYGDRMPPTARVQVQIVVSALRRLLVAAGAQLIDSHAQGYAIRLADGQLDAARFAGLTAAARAARDSGALEQAVARYQEALRLWRGPALAGLDSDAIRLAVGNLDEQRVLATEDRITLELELGRPHEVLAELGRLVREFPLRERLREQFMLALYQCGRVADALEAYRDARRVLVEELGVEPNERLRRLHGAILAGAAPPIGPASLAPTSPAARATVRPAAAPEAAPDPAPRPWSTGRRPVPRLLPADIADFTGRDPQVGEIRQLLAGPGDETRLAVPIAAISGKGGVGKTSLAVHTAHAVAPSFPDGQLFADLHGATAPVNPAKVLDRFLRVLGVTGSDVPETLEERAEAYRDLVADRRVLVLLDDVASEAQVAPLLPGTPTSAVIVTSRGRLAALAGAVHVDLDVFDAGKSIELIAKIAGAERVAGQEGPAATLAEFCGNLPLALRIVGARLSARRNWSLQQLVGRLSDEARRLDELQYGDMAIRASISLSYEGASEGARRLFRRIAVLDMQAIPDWAPAALLGEPGADADDLLDELISAQLIEITAGAQGGQHHFHDLIRLFARERLVAEEPADERRATLGRVLGALLGLAEEAYRREHGGCSLTAGGAPERWPLPGWLADQLIADPMAWYERERATLLAGIRQAARAGLTGLCWRLAYSPVLLYKSRFYLDDWREAQEIALAAAQRDGDARGEAVTLYSAGSLCLVEQRYEQARERFMAAARLFRDGEDEYGTALVIRDIAYLDRMAGHLEDAARRYEQALPLFRASGNLADAAHVLQGLAQVRLDQGEAAAAQPLLAEALQLSQEAGDGRGEAQVLHRMGEAYLRRAEHALAEQSFSRALAKVREARDALGESHVLHGLGVTHARQGDLVSARAVLDSALRLARSLGDRLVESRALLALADLALAEGDPRRAATLADEAAAIFGSARMPRYEAQARDMATLARALRQ